jgi:hypothetical protein
LGWFDLIAFELEHACPWFDHGRGHGVGPPGGGFLFDSEEYNDGSDEPTPMPLHAMLSTQQQQQSLQQQAYGTGDVDGGFSGEAFGFGDSGDGDCSDSDSDGDGDARSSGTFKTTYARLGNRIRSNCAANYACLPPCI